MFDEMGCREPVHGRGFDVLGRSPSRRVYKPLGDRLIPAMRGRFWHQQEASVPPRSGPPNFPV